MTMDPKRKFEDILAQSIEKVHQGEESVESVVNQFPEHSEDLRRDLEASLWLAAKREHLEARPGFVAAWALGRPGNPHDPNRGPAKFME